MRQASRPTECGKAGVTRRLLTEVPGVPSGPAVASAKRNDLKLVRTTIASIVVGCPEATPEPPPGRWLDTGYAFPQVREILAACGCTAHLRVRGEEAKISKHESGFRAPVAGRRHTPLDEPRAPHPRALGDEA